MTLNISFTVPTVQVAEYTANGRVHIYDNTGKAVPPPVFVIDGVTYTLSGCNLMPNPIIVDTICTLTPVKSPNE